MGRLMKLDSEEVWSLAREELIGRSKSCDRLLDDRHVSGQHASIRWTGKAWELHDLASRNGTFVQGRRLAARERVLLLPQMRIQFGLSSAEWVLVDASPPLAVAIRVRDRQRVVESAGLIALPSEAVPRMFLELDEQGRWVCEPASGVDARVIEDDATLMVEGEAWRFRTATPAAGTSGSSSARTSVDSLVLRFRVSPDEEQVQLLADISGKTLPVDTRAHHYLLLTLARERLAQARAGSSSALSHGWIHQDTMSRMLKKSPTLLNVEIYRARRQFAELGVRDAARIIERRRDTGEIRLGCSSFEIERLPDAPTEPEHS
jgi:hypothetical protein